MADPTATIDSIDLAANPENPKEHILTISTTVTADGMTHTSMVKCVCHDYIFNGTPPTAEQVKATIVAQALRFAALKALAESLKADVAVDLVAQAKGK